MPSSSSPPWPQLESTHPLLPSDMEVPVAAFTVLILTETLASQTCCASLGADTPTACCFFFISRKIPRKFVVDYYETSSQCPKAAVIFQTKRGREVCADPGDIWVQEYISDLELNSGVAT